MKLNPRSQQSPPRRKLVRVFSIAVLFLATGAAHAGPFYKWHCGEYTVTVHHKPPQQTSNDRSYGYIQIEPYLPSHDVHFSPKPRCSLQMEFGSQCPKCKRGG